jgi:hypothetical protein
VFDASALLNFNRALSDEPGAASQFSSFAVAGARRFTAGVGDVEAALAATALRVSGRAMVTAANAVAAAEQHGGLHEDFVAFKKAAAAGDSGPGAGGGEEFEQVGVPLSLLLAVNGIAMATQVRLCACLKRSD